MSTDQLPLDYRPHGDKNCLAHLLYSSSPTRVSKRQPDQRKKEKEESTNNNVYLTFIIRITEYTLKSMCKMDHIQMQDFGILKDIFTKIKCHTANLSLFNIRNYIREYRKFFPSKFLQEIAATHNSSVTTISWLQNKAPFSSTPNPTRARLVSIF